MKKNILFFLSLILFLSSYSQDFTGQWKGIFTDRSSPFGGGECEYVLELECKGTSVTGSSYTYSSEGGKTYYSICTVVGFIDKKQKYIEVKETERTKTNWPINVGNCLQVHKLTYFKKGDTSTLEGRWEPAPNQGNCGFGTTVLSRRELKQSFPNFTGPSTKRSPLVKDSETKVIAKKTTPKINPPIVKNVPKNNAVKTIKPKQNKNVIASAKPNKDIIKKETPIPLDSVIPEDKISPETIIAPKIKFEKRNNTLLKTITVENKTVKVDLYDNGEVDGDSISLFYNGKLLMSSKRLSEKAITLTINVEDDVVNELVMYAENLGTIPPNTALMVVTDGPKRYEVRITSDLQKSGVINFIHKPHPTGN